MAAILVVDDDDTIRDAICELFEEQHLCHTAATTEEAFARLGKQDYDVIVTDLTMPGMSGENLLRLTRVHHPNTPVIFITGSIERQKAQELKVKGAFDYLLKPFRLEDIEACVNRALEHRRRLLERRP